MNAFLPLLRAGSTKHIVLVGSASIDPKFIRGVGIGDMVAYGMTKAAQHIAAVKWSVKLQPEGFTVITMSPGVVDTLDTSES